MSLMLEELHFAKGIDPVADAFAGTVQSDVYSIRDYGRIVFVVYVGVGATGSSTITVESCDDTVPTNVTTIPFWSREITSGDTEGAITRQAAAGFVNTVGSSRIVLVEADAKDAVSERGFVRCVLVESVDSPVLGGIMALQGGKPTRYAEDVKATVLS